MRGEIDRLDAAAGRIWVGTRPVLQHELCGGGSHHETNCRDLQPVLAFASGNHARAALKQG
jgi:hypothetical protein